MSDIINRNKLIKILNEIIMDRTIAVNNALTNDSKKLCKGHLELAEYLLDMLNKKEDWFKEEQ